MLDRHQHRAAPLSPDSESLCESQNDQQYRGPNPDLIVSRKTADQKSRDAHDEQRQDEHRPAPDLVAEVAADYTSDRTGCEPYRVSAERSERACQRVVVWK